MFFIPATFLSLCYIPVKLDSQTATNQTDSGVIDSLAIHHIKTFLGNSGQDGMLVQYFQTMNYVGVLIKLSDKNCIYYTSKKIILRLLLGGYITGVVKIWIITNQQF